MSFLKFSSFPQSALRFVPFWSGLNQSNPFRSPLGVPRGGGITQMPGSKFADLVEKPEMEVEGGARYKGQWRGTMRRRVEDRLCFFLGFGVMFKPTNLTHTIHGWYIYLHTYIYWYHKSQPSM